jgi:hypothetical protein
MSSAGGDRLIDLACRPYEVGGVALVSCAIEQWKIAQRGVSVTSGATAANDIHDNAIWRVSVDMA